MNRRKFFTLAGGAVAAAALPFRAQASRIYFPDTSTIVFITGLKGGEAYSGDYTFFEIPDIYNVAVGPLYEVRRTEDVLDKEWLREGPTGMRVYVNFPGGVLVHGHGLSPSKCVFHRIEGM